jgi:hypothetical protein
MKAVEFEAAVPRMAKSQSPRRKMNKELPAVSNAGCRCIQIEEPTFHFML